MRMATFRRNSTNEIPLESFSLLNISFAQRTKCLGYEKPLQIMRLCIVAQLLSELNREQKYVPKKDMSTGYGFFFQV
jgi:hypothetical protein